MALWFVFLFAIVCEASKRVLPSFKNDKEVKEKFLELSNFKDGPFPSKTVEQFYLGPAFAKTFLTICFKEKLFGALDLILSNPTITVGTRVNIFNAAMDLNNDEIWDYFFLTDRFKNAEPSANQLVGSFYFLII